MEYLRGSPILLKIFSSQAPRDSLPDHDKLLKRQPADAAATSLLQEALDALTDHIALLGPDGEVITVNQAWADFGAVSDYRAGSTEPGVNYCDICDSWAGASAEAAHAEATGIRQVLAGEIEHFEQEYSCRSRTTEHWFRMTARRLVRPGPVAAIITHTDRTRERLAARAEAEARAKAEAEHRARATEEVLFRSLTERSLEFVSILDAEGRFKYMSQSLEGTVGYTVDDLLGTYPVDLVHPDDRAIMLGTFFTLIKGGPGTVAEMTVRLRHKDGSWRYFEGGGQNLLHEPSVRGIMSNARDVTARVDAERARYESEARFRRFVETTHEGVLAMDSTGAITYANPRTGTLLGYPPT